MPCTVLENAVHWFQGCSSDSTTISRVLWKFALELALHLTGVGGRLFFILQERISILEMVEFGWWANPDIIVRTERHDTLLLCLCVCPCLIIPIRLYMLRKPSLDQVYPTVSF